MMAAGQAAGLLDLVEDTADHVAQRLLDDLVVRDQGLCKACRRSSISW